MDRPLDARIRRTRLAKRVVLPLVGLAVLAAALLGASAFARPSVRRADIRTARVERGALDATITGTGIVVPEFEQAIASPLDARVLRVLKRPGAIVNAGEPIVELDVSEAKVAVEKLDRNLALKENQEQRAGLDLAATLSSLDAQIQIKRLQQEAFRATCARNTALHREGLLSAELVHQGELDLARAGIELEQAIESRGIARKSTAAQLRGLALEREILRQDRDEAARQLALATTEAVRGGVLTYVTPEIGAAVSKGAVLARVADLDSLRVDATISDVHASRLAVGLPVDVDANGTRLAGFVARVLPAVQNGVITAEIELDETSSRNLKPNLRVDVFVVTQRKADVLRLEKGAFASAEGKLEVFVVRGRRAVRTVVRVGAFGANDVEILEGLTEGDEVIVSSTSDYASANEIRID